MGEHQCAWASTFLPWQIGGLHQAELRYQTRMPITLGKSKLEAHQSARRSAASALSARAPRVAKRLLRFSSTA
jgi:hypothetical protein